MTSINRTSDSRTAERTPERVAAMLTAVELQVDRDDFSFRSDGERHLWDELEAEFAELVEREGSVWSVD